MRTLNLNKRPIWQVQYLGEVPILDEDGLDTGEVKKQYSEPVEIRLNLYTTTSDIIQNMFGMTNNINIVCSDERKLEWVLNYFITNLMPILILNVILIWNLLPFPKV